MNSDNDKLNRGKEDQMLYNNAMGNCIEGIRKWLKRRLRLGAQYHIGGRRLRILKQIATGGYGSVHLVEDIETGEELAMKRVICQTQEQRDLYSREVQTLKELAEAQYVIRCYGNYERKRDDVLEGYMVMEVAQKTLLDVVGQEVSEERWVQVLREVCLGLGEMHKMGLVHCDVKVENVLVVGGVCKLGDLGSATREKVDLRAVSKQEVYLHEERFSKCTTLMYRPPEMVDPYLRYRVDEQADVWMLGCVAYLLSYKVHPFVQMTKLAIVNAHVLYPPHPTVSAKMQTLLRSMLTPNPAYRITLPTILTHLQNWHTTTIQLNPIAAIILANEQRQAIGIYQRLQWRDIK